MRLVRVARVRFRSSAFSLAALSTQGLWSLRTIMISSVGAHALDNQKFGVLAVCIIVQFGIARIVRSAITDAVVTEAIRTSRRPPQALPMVCLVVTLPAVSALLLWRVVPSSWQALLLALALVPLLCFADSARLVLLAKGQNRLCLVQDTLWTLVLVASASAIALASASPQFLLVIAWSLSGLVYLFLPQFRVFGRFGEAWQEVARVHVASRHQLADTVIDVTVSYGSLLGAAALVGQAAVASIYGAQTITGPVSFVFTTTIPLLILAFAQMQRDSVPTTRLVLLIAASAIGLLTIWGVSLSAFPVVGRMMFGVETWGIVAPVVIPVSIFVGGVAAQSVITAWHRAVGRTERLVRLRTASSMLLLVTVPVGAIASDARAVAWSLGATSLCGAAVWARAVIGFSDGGRARSRESPEHFLDL